MNNIFHDFQFICIAFSCSQNIFVSLLFFQIEGDNVDCWMEIQSGKGPWAPPVSGIVPLGSTLTLVVAINDFRGELIET